MVRRPVSNLYLRPMNSNSLATRLRYSWSDDQIRWFFVLDTLSLFVVVALAIEAGGRQPRSKLVPFLIMSTLTHNEPFWWRRRDSNPRLISVMYKSLYNHFAGLLIYRRSLCRLMHLVVKRGSLD
jgi:hypothetical protein